MKNGKVSFAPLKNYEKVLKDPTDKENDINFIDNIRCDRTILMSIVASKYPELVQEFFELAIENKTQISNILSESFLPDMQEKYGSIIYENISELQRIIEQVKSKDIVDYSKSESHFSKEKIDRIAKQKEVALEDENSNEIISEIEKLCERQNENQNPTLE